LLYIRPIADSHHPPSVAYRGNYLTAMKKWRSGKRRDSLALESTSWWELTDQLICYCMQHETKVMVLLWLFLKDLCNSPNDILFVKFQ